jgi:HAMP domain-containing protein
MTVSSSERGLQLAQKLSLLLSAIFIFGLSLSAVWIFSSVSQTAQTEISSKAAMLMSTMDSVRSYTSQNIKPKLDKAIEHEFLSESVPAFAAQSVFSVMQKSPEYQNFSYREAALNPMNLANKAKPFEVEIINTFRRDSETKQLNGFQTLPKIGDAFYTAKPLKIGNISCLQCHSTPDKAPKTMLDKYGSIHGFGWQMNEVIGAQLVFVPAGKIVADSRNLFNSIVGLIVFIFVAIIFTVNFWMKRQVVVPISEMARTVTAISMGELNGTLKNERKDEIGQLAKSIDRLSTSLGMAMNRLSKSK